MSVAFAPPQKGRPAPSPAQIQKMLDENSQLIQGILDYQSKGKSSECLQYQQILHRNLVYLASIADAMPSLLPPPPAQVPGCGNQQGTVAEPSRIPSPSSSQSNAQQAHSQAQMNLPSGSRGNQQSPGSSGAVATQGPGAAPHTTYSMTSQSTTQTHQSAVNHMQSPSGQQSSAQANHTVPHNGQSSTGTYSRSVTPQQYGSLSGGSQYSATYSSSQSQSPHPYNGSVQSQNNFSQQNSSANFSNEGAQNFQSAVSQSQGYGTAPSSQTQTQQQVTTSQQQQHVSQAQEYSNNTVSPQTTYSSPSTPSSASQSYTTQSSQTYVTQTQSYNASSNSATQWYQANNSQPCSSATSQNFPSSSVAQGYAGTVNHTGNFSSQSAAQSGYGSPPTSTPSQTGFVHHSPSSAAHESPPPAAAAMQQNRFSSSFSSYVHYRPSSQPTSHSAVGSPMGPPPNSMNRPQISGGSSQNQNYSYNQAQNYPPYQSQ